MATGASDAEDAEFRIMCLTAFTRAGSDDDSRLLIAAGTSERCLKVWYCCRSRGDARLSSFSRLIQLLAFDKQTSEVSLVAVSVTFATVLCVTHAAVTAGGSDFTDLVFAGTTRGVVQVFDVTAGQGCGPVVWSEDTDICCSEVTPVASFTVHQSGVNAIDVSVDGTPMDAFLPGCSC